MSWTWFFRFSVGGTDRIYQLAKSNTATNRICDTPRQWCNLKHSFHHRYSMFARSSRLTKRSSIFQPVSRVSSSPVQLYLALNDYWRADHHTRGFTALNLPYPQTAVSSIDAGDGTWTHTLYPAGDFNGQSCWYCPNHILDTTGPPRLPIPTHQQNKLRITLNKWNLYGFFTVFFKNFVYFILKSILVHTVSPDPQTGSCCEH